MGDRVADVVTSVLRARAAQQPEWSDLAQVRRVKTMLVARPPLVRLDDVLTLRYLLSHVAAGEAHVIQAGDCAEDPDDCTREQVARKCAVLDLLAGTLKMATHTPVLRVGRIAGQFTKPRSGLVEWVGGQELPVFRGHMVNGPELNRDSRSADPLRILGCYMAAREIVEQLGWAGPGCGPPRLRVESPIWTSHEALLLDYELPMLREAGGGQRWLGSTHWPWIGERTRQVDGAHVAMLAEVVNPVACKIGPGIDVTEIVALCDRLDPQREPGALTLIARLGADLVADRLPRLVDAVRRAGHPVIWLCDPMHGNTLIGQDGRKIRVVETIMREIREFRIAVAAAGGVAGGLHLETTPEDVTECVEHTSCAAQADRRHTSFCDPRLNPAQAVAVISAWSDTG